MSIDFMEAIIPPDTIPETLDSVPEYPCENCGKEAGPYGGRGRKPKFCSDCKPNRKSNPVKVTGAAGNLASQAAITLGQLNGILCIGLMTVGMIETAKAIASENDMFEEKARQALLTDPDLCRMILKGGVKSAKISLTMAYVGMGVAVAPTALAELREKKAERDAKREAEMNEAGT